MQAVVPWKALIDLIEPYYPKTGSKGGRSPYPLETMLRIHLMQQRYDLSGPAMEDALIEVPTMRRFAGINLISDRNQDETTILSFRHLLEKHDLGKQIFETVKAHLKANGMAMKQGTILERLRPRRRRHQQPNRLSCGRKPRLQRSSPGPPRRRRSRRLKMLVWSHRRISTRSRLTRCPGVVWLAKPTAHQPPRPNATSPTPTVI
jgi:hypothetical protein